LSITVYSKPSCQPCIATYRELDKAALPYQSIVVTEDSEALAYAASLGHQQSPVVVISDDEGNVTQHWSGYRPDSLKALSS